MDDDLEEGLAATSHPPSSNRSSSRSATAIAVTATSPPSSPSRGSSAAASLRNDHIQTATTTTANQSDVSPEVAAAAAAADATARHGSGSSVYRPSLQSQQASSTQRPAMLNEFIQSRSNVTSSGLPTGVPTRREVAAAPAAITAAINVLTGPELVGDTSGPPLPIGMVEEALAEEGTSSMGRAACNPAPAAAANQPFGLEFIDDDDGPPPPVPIGMDVEGERNVEKKRAVVTLVEDESGPDPPATLIDPIDTKTDLVYDASPSLPFNPFSLEEDFDADKKKRASIPSDGESIIIPTREEMEGDDQPLTTTSRGARGWDGQTTQVDDHADIESNILVDENNTIDTGGANDSIGYPDLEPDNTVESDLGGDMETQIITEAYPVEERSDDGLVIVGQPLLPWWKQRRAKMSFAAVIVLFVILAVSLGVPLSLKAPATVVFSAESSSESLAEKPSDAPSTTSSPSYDNSYSPSVSLVPTAIPSIQPSITPSYSPSACVDQISSNAKKIDLQIDYPSSPKVAVDGKDMVIVAQQEGGNGRVFIIFYTLAKGEWQRVKTFQEVDLGPDSSFALSGTTAFVGFSNANDGGGTVSIYKKDQYGDWNLMKDPFVHGANATHFWFGYHVDIDRDLACVQDAHGTYVYREENNKWVEFDRIDDGDHCSIAGDTIATEGGKWNYNMQLYKYNQELNGVFPIQGPIPPGGLWPLGLSNDYLVFWDSEEEDAFMYRWNETNHTYTFHQQFNISFSWDNRGLALDNDILVVRGNGKTHIFAEQTNGTWEKTITLDKSYYSYAISGRNLLATTSWVDGDEVYYLDIEGCSQAMPTQTPSLSTAPTDRPSSYPTLAPSSSSPTLLHCIEVAITYDRWPIYTNWELWRVVDNSDDDELVKSHWGSFGDTTYFESLCLQEAEYIFTIFDLDGICCKYGKGNYKVTSNGMLIVKGGEWDGQSESTPFYIPFVPSS